MLEFAPARRLAAAGVATLALALLLGAAGAQGAGVLVAYNLYPLVSDGSAVPAPLADPSLVNGWGLVAGPTTPWWTSNNKTNTSTLYNGGGSKSALTVTVPGGPTGIIFNANPADWNGGRFIFATQSGTIQWWSSGGSSNTGADNSSQGALYDGLASLNDRLYAADFHNGRIDVFDNAFHPVSLPNAFTDAKIPAGFAPFNIQALNGNLFVTYAKQDAAKKNSIPAPGQGYVDEFDPNGVLMMRVASSGNKNAPLNAPWGLALAPSNFGAYSNDLLVGNFGNGRINAYAPASATKWVYKGQVRTADGKPITVDGLWGIAFGTGGSSGPTNNLYVLAGPTNQTHGLLGFIAVG